ncbi:MAG: TetR/AcrR family transcriptional regulator, partial [Ensifer adhaerens]|nr:TetR/AcrR family transcriptional regulator [Ensifer adhaerens]
LSDGVRSPLDRLRSLVHAFLRSECEEAAVRVALGDAAPLYRDAPEAREAKEANDPLIDQFMIELLPNAPADTRELAGDLIMTTMTTVGKDFSGTARSDAEIEAYSNAMADMFSAYLVAKGAGT